jgi:2-methylcitrate dehydratase PrpD
MVQTNGHTNGGTNGDTNGGTNGHAAQPPVTKLLASFVADAQTSQLTEELREKVKEVLIDFVGVVVGALNNADSTDPIYKAIVALQGPGNNGSCTVLAKGKPHMMPQYASLLNSAFGHSMDFDDTYAPGTLHAGVTAVSAALTQAELLGDSSDSERFMLAVAVGYEVTCRIGRELGYEAYSRGMHNTSTAGIFGAVSAIAFLKGLKAETIEMAFGLAGSKAAGSMQYLDNGSWNKRLHPGFAVHDAFMCVSLAEAGVIGATKIIEGKMGFLHAYSPNPHKDLHRLIAGLGTDWEWLKSSLKPYPACRMTHALIEISGNLHNSHNNGQVSPSDVDRILLTISSANFSLVGDPTPNKIHPENVIDAQFSAYYQVANALLYGSATGMQAYHKLADSNIHGLCDKITVQTDDSMKQFGAKLEITWSDGQSETVEQAFPLGEEQHPFTRDRVDEKFLSLAGPVYGKGKATEIIKLVDDMERHSVEDLLEMLR